MCACDASILHSTRTSSIPSLISPTTTIVLIVIILSISHATRRQRLNHTGRNVWVRGRASASSSHSHPTTTILVTRHIIPSQYRRGVDWSSVRWLCPESIFAYYYLTRRGILSNFRKTTYRDSILNLLILSAVHIHTYLKNLHLYVEK